MNEPVKTIIKDSILEVTIDRPKANAIDAKTSIILGEIFSNFRDDPNLKVAIITGVGGIVVHRVHVRGVSMDEEKV